MKDSCLSCQWLDWIDDKVFFYGRCTNEQSKNYGNTVNQDSYCPLYEELSDEKT